MIITSRNSWKQYTTIDFELRFARDCLQHLVMNVVVNKKERDLHRLFSLVEACPRLNKLEVKVCFVS